MSEKEEKMDIKFNNMINMIITASQHIATRDEILMAIRDVANGVIYAIDAYEEDGCNDKSEKKLPNNVEKMDDAKMQMIKDRSYKVVRRVLEIEMEVREKAARKDAVDGLNLISVKSNEPSTPPRLKKELEVPGAPIKKRRSSYNIGRETILNNKNNRSKQVLNDFNEA